MLAFVFANAQKNTTNLVSSTDTETVIKFNVNSYNLHTVVTPNGKEVIITAEDASQLLIAEAPDLAKFTKSIIIPDASKMQIEVISSKFKEIDIETNIAPSKGNLLRNINPNDVPYTYGDVYNQNDFFPGQLADLNTPYIARDYRGQAVNIYPFQYNPITKKLRIYTEIIVKISATTGASENVFNRTRTFDKLAREFNNIYSSHFLNYDNSRYTPVLEEGNMLIICYDDWTAEMQPLVDWKNTIGRPCEMVTVTEAGGTSSAIATYVENYYNDNGLTYLLLVGDATQCPTNSGGFIPYGDSDNAYAYIIGNDHYLDFFVGRFSAETAAHVETQVQRTIIYENGSTLEDGWLNITMGLTSNQGPGDDNEMDYDHYRNLATDLLDFTYTESRELFDGSQGGNDASGSPTPSMVGDEMNNGVGIINYTGHGSETAWGSSGFSISGVNNLTNNNKLPFIFDVACVNGAYTGMTCFAEAFLRATNGDDPTGAIAIVASTINQSWAPPMAGQDEMVDLLVGTSTNGTKRTFTGIAVNGMFLMNDETSDFAMTDTWTTFGDPSVLVRTDDVSDMAISHNPTILVGQTEFAVNCDLDGGFACLSKDGVILGTATVSGGVANISFGDVNPGEELTIAVTGFNKVTYLETVTVIAPSGPYITIGDFEINEGNSINYGQSGNINITLTNVGPEDATGVTATLTTTDEYVASLTDNTDINFGTIAGDNGTAISSGSFSITLANNVPDQHIISFELVITDESKATYDGVINITANAPVLEVAFDAINDNSDELSFVSNPIVVISENENYSYDITVEGNAGNGNGLLDPGETVAISVNTGNVGHANLLAAECTLTSTNPHVTVNSGIHNLGLVEVGASVPAVFNITIDESTPIGESVELIITFLGGEYEEVLELNLPVGLQIEDFESGDFSAYSWTMAGDADWAIQESTIYEGVYSAVSGDINDNQTSALEVTINVNEESEISFWYNLSSEESYDELHFYIDGNEVNEYADEAWTEVIETIPAGTHTLKWTYEKDGSVSNDDDCVYLDLITFPGHSAGAKSTKGATITAPTLPTWLTITDNGDGTANLSGTTPNEHGTHNVVLQAQDTGEPTTQEFTIVVGMVSISSLDGNIKFYPNPTSGMLNINLPQATDTKLTLVDITGKVVERFNTNTQIINIDLSNKSKGVYMLKLEIDSEIINQKIIVE